MVAFARSVDRGIPTNQAILRKLEEDVGGQRLSISQAVAASGVKNC